MSTNERSTGGPAFPAVNHHGHKLTGMTLRDYFAAKALQGLLSDLPKSLHGFDWANNTAKEAYSLADAMLKARDA